MATLDDLLPDLAVHISHVPAFIARPMLRQAVQIFCQHSYFWQFDALFTLDGNGRYLLAIADGLLVAGIVAAAHNGEPLRQGFDYELSADEKAVVVINPRLSSGTLTLIIAVKPSRKSDLIDDNVVEHYGTAIACGAAALLGANEKQEWAISKHQIIDYRTRFEAAYQEARKRALNHASRLYEAPTKHTFF